MFVIIIKIWQSLTQSFMVWRTYLCGLKTSLCRDDSSLCSQERGNQKIQHGTRPVLLLMYLCNYALRNVDFLTSSQHNSAITSQYRFNREIYTVRKFQLLSLKFIWESSIILLQHYRVYYLPLTLFRRTKVKKKNYKGKKSVNQ